MSDFKYYMITLSRWFRELRLKMSGYRRDFFCQKEIEGNKKCKLECLHCVEFYKPLNDEDRWN